MQFTFGDKSEVYLLDESALPVTEKESMQKGNKTGLQPVSRPVEQILGFYNALFER